MVIATPTIVAPMKRLTISPHWRIHNPTVNSTKEIKSIRSNPNCFDTLGASPDKVAKAKSGNVVKSPANIFDKSKASLISEITGPTEVSGARRLAAINTIPTTIKTSLNLEEFFFAWFELDCDPCILKTVRYLRTNLVGIFEFPSLQFDKQNQ